MILSVTFFLTAAFALMLVSLSTYTSLKRRQLQVAFGDAKDETPKRRIRAHGNFVENAPFLLIVVGCLELGTQPQAFVALIALAFLIARLVHACGALFGKGATFRAAAMVIQHTTTVVAAVTLVFMVIMSGHS